MQINNVSPPPIDNDPPPPDDAGKKKLMQFISKNSWASFKTWLATQLTAAVNQILAVLKNVTESGGTLTIGENVEITGTTKLDGNVTMLGSLNGLSPVPGMAQMRQGSLGFIGNGAEGVINYNIVVNVITGSYTITSATGSYYRVGKLVFLFVAIQVGTVTTAGVLSFSMPPELPIGTTQVWMGGREDATSGIALSCIAVSATAMEVFAYNGGNSVVASGNLFHISGVYYTP